MHFKKRDKLYGFLTFYTSKIKNTQELTAIKMEYILHKTEISVHNLLVQNINREIRASHINSLINYISVKISYIVDLIE